METGYKKQANYKDSFEDIYLRHDYLKKTNPDSYTDMKKYEKICKATAKIMYEKHRMRFNKVSFYYEDILNITRVYSYSFLNVYSFSNDIEGLEKFKSKFLQKQGKLPSKEEVEKRERNNLINFLRQRLSACSIVCERKSKDIVASKAKKVYFAYTANSVPASYDLILEDHKLFGYRLVTDEEMAVILKNNKGNLVDNKGFPVFEVESHSQIPVSFFTKVVYRDSSEGELIEVNHDRVSLSAEDRVLEMEEEIELANLKNRFDKLNQVQKRNRLKNFIKNNSKDSRFQEEIDSARKMLKQLSNMV